MEGAMRALNHATVPRQIARGLGWGALAAAVLLALAIALPLAFGARPHTVLTGSMEPAISPGDVVIDERISPTAVAVGDVVTFRDPEDQSRLITHRVRSIRRDGAHLWFITQGDANNTTERWRVAADGELGRVAYSVPWVGHVAVLSHTPLGLALFLFVPLLLLGLDELLRIWRPSGGRVSHGAP
jgi:signal peptidase I